MLREAEMCFLPDLRLEGNGLGDCGDGSWARAGVAGLDPEGMMLLQPEFPTCRPDAVVDPWLVALWDKILALYPLPPGLEIISPDVR